MTRGTICPSLLLSEETEQIRIRGSWERNYCAATRIQCERYRRPKAQHHGCFCCRCSIRWSWIHQQLRTVLPVAVQRLWPHVVRLRYSLSCFLFLLAILLVLCFSL